MTSSLQAPAVSYSLAELCDCADLFGELAHGPVDGAYVFRIGVKSKTALDRLCGVGNRYTAELVRIVMDNVRSPRDSVPSDVSLRVWRLLMHVARVRTFKAALG